MDIPYKTLATWDFDIIFDEVLQKYIAIYSKGVTGDIIVAESSDVLGTWTLKDEASNNGEGNLFWKVGDKRYITRTSVTKTGLDLVSYPELAPLGIIVPDVWCGSTTESPLSWGNVISVNNGDKTTFYILAFSLNKFANNFYGYGDLWIYKAREEQQGLEYENLDMLFFD